MWPLHVIFLISPLIAAFNLEGRVIWNSVCPGYKELGHTNVILDDGGYFGSVRRDGSFVIPYVNAGSYILSVQSHDFIFDTLRIDVSRELDVPSEQSENSPTIFPDVYPYILGTPHDPPSNVSLSYPVTLVPRAKNQYFVEHQSFNVMGMLRNPMIMMMVATGVLVVAMPYIMKNMDPELAREVTERQNKLAHIQNSMTSGDFKGGLSALLAGDENHAAPEPQRASTSTPSRRGGGSSKGRRR